MTLSIRLARLFLQTEIWLTARLLPVWIAFRELEGILRIANAGKSNLYSAIQAQTVIDIAGRATRKHWLMRNRRCLRQGLIGYRFLKKAGFEPELHFGIDPTSTTKDKTLAHCWVVLDGKPVINDIMDNMITLHVHKTAAGDEE